MSFTGHVQNGVIVLDDPVTLPEGTEVEVAVRDATADSRPSLWDRLKDVVGKADGLPADASARVDHYLTHGLPKE
jgi:predicted DNA-binding antitoxin AbrB/MazE fold protein